MTKYRIKCDFYGTIIAFAKGERERNYPSRALARARQLQRTRIGTSWHKSLDIFVP